jgi:cytochrome c551/c552
LPLLLSPVLNGNSTAHAAQVPVVVRESASWQGFPPHGVAFGLYVPGSGSTVSRANALASIERGRVANAALGGRPSGAAKIHVTRSATNASPAIFITLPPPGRHRNMRRYSIAVVARGYDGILTSSSTRIPGLVAVTDIADTAVALAEGGEPPIRSRRGDPKQLVALDRRLRRAHDVRSGAIGIAAGILAALVALAFLLRLRLLARVAVVFGAAVVSASLITSGSGWERATPVLVGLAGISLALAATAALVPRAPVVTAALLALLLVLAIDTSINSFGPLGPHPEGGGRFYGVGNQEETLLLAPVLAAAAGPSALVPVGLLAVVTVGWSHAGADGGGMLVLAAGLAVLWLRLRGFALTARRLALVAAGAVALGLALIGLDAAFGGSSHVTHSVGSGSVFDEIWDRWRLSWAVVTSSWHKGLLFVVSLAGLVWLATRRPRTPTVDAIVAAVVVSLVVNDTPVDVAGLGALGGLALLAWERTRRSVDSRRMRRPLLALPLVALLMAGCGSEGKVRAVPETVVGTVQAEAPGKAIFTGQGCNGCHTYQPAGATATVGPDLDKLPDYAKKAKQPLDAFVRESIVKPGAYVEKGYQDVMPKQYGSLPKSDIDALVQFLTKSQG